MHNGLPRLTEPMVRENGALRVKAVPLLLGLLLIAPFVDGGSDPAVLTQFKGLVEGKTEALRIDVVRLKFSIGSSDATHVNSDGQVAYKTKFDFKTVEFPTSSGIHPGCAAENGGH